MSEGIVIEQEVIEQEVIEQGWYGEGAKKVKIVADANDNVWYNVKGQLYESYDKQKRRTLALIDGTYYLCNIITRRRHRI